MAETWQSIYAGLTIGLSPMQAKKSQKNSYFISFIYSYLAHKMQEK